MDFININDSVKTAIRIAKAVAREYGNSYYTPAHLLKGLLHKEVGLQSFIDYLEKDLGYFEEWAEVRIDDEPKIIGQMELVADDRIAGVFEEADNARIKLGLFEINPICVLAALARPEVGFTHDQLKSFPIKEGEIYELYVHGQDTKSNIIPELQKLSEASGGKALTSLFKYCIDRNSLVEAQSEPRVVGRSSEMRMMMEILGRHSKPNVLIVGEAGVGKTALIEGLVHNIINKKVPSHLEGANIYELDTGALIAGATYKGEIEDRLKGLIKELRTIDRSILFIDEIHMLLDPKQGNAGAGHILKPELSRGDLIVIGITTMDEYRKLIEPDQAFSRRFEVLQVDEPNSASAAKMIESVLPSYKEYHKLQVTNEAIHESVRLAKRYVKDRRLPDAAIDLMDRTMAAIKMMNESSKQDIQDILKELAKIEEQVEIPMEDKMEDLRFVLSSMQNQLSPILLGKIQDRTDTKEIDNADELYNYLLKSLENLQKEAENKIEKVSPNEVAAVIASKTGIPIGKLQAQEKERLLNMEDLLRRRVVGQDHALKALVDAILESRSGMNKQGQPIGSFFLLGPTGTGKTELAKAMAESLFNDEKAMIRFDMSEFKEEHSAALLYGAPPGYVGYEEGGMLVNKIRQQPYSVVLFDEIEKAHASVYDTFLQIMDEGKLHDRLGKEGDFSNALVIFTSNVGSEWITEQLAEGKVPTTTQLMDVMSRHFRPEFLARLSEIVPFSPISEDILLMIFDIQFEGLRELLTKQGIEIMLTDEAKRMLAHKGFTPKYGARQVSGMIRNYLRRPISRLIIGGKLTKGNKLTVGLDEAGELTWDVK